MIGEIVTGTFKLFVVVAAAALYNHYAPGKTPESQFKTAEAYSQPKPANTREALSLVDGKVLPKDYESKLFIFGKDTLEARKTGNKESDDSQVQPLSDFEQAVEKHNSKSFKDVLELYNMLPKSGKLGELNIDDFHVETVYRFAFNHKALACFNSDQKCDNNELTSTTDSQPEQMTREEEGHSATVDAQYGQMFFFDKFVDEVIRKWQLPGVIPTQFALIRHLNLQDDADSRSVKQSLIDLALKVLTKIDPSKINNPVPAFGYKELYLLSDDSGKNLYLLLAVKTATFNLYNPEQLSDLYRSRTGKEIKQYMLGRYLQ